MTVYEFCKHHTSAQELVLICDPWPAQAVWIDDEDLFCVHPDLADKEVKSDTWGTLPIADNSGVSIVVPCHYVYV